MTKTSKLTLIALLAATVIGSPALAQAAAAQTFRHEVRIDSPAATGGASLGYNHAQENVDGH